MLSVFNCTATQYISSGELRVYNSSVFGPGLVHSVVAGSEVLLSCPSPAPWLLCIWVSPGGDRRCQVSLQEDRVEVCGQQAQQDSILTSSSAGGCELRLVSEVRDHGVWTCMLTLDTAGQYDSLVTRLVLSVSSPASLSLSRNETHLTCRAELGYPAPALSWRLDQTSPAPACAERSVLSSSSHLVSTTSSLALSSLPTNTSRLTCTARQQASPGQPELVRTVETSVEALQALQGSGWSHTALTSTDITLLLLCGGLCCLGNSHSLTPHSSKLSQLRGIIFQAWLSVSSPSLSRQSLSGAAVSKVSSPLSSTFRLGARQTAGPGRITINTRQFRVQRRKPSSSTRSWSSSTPNTSQGLTTENRWGQNRSFIVPKAALF